MSSDNLTPNPPWDDPRITDYVMNEMNVADKASFEAEMQDNESLANAVAEAREITAKLSGFYASIPEEQLDANRRAELSSQPEPVVKSVRSPFQWVTRLVVAASIIFVMAVLTYPMIKESLQTAQTGDVAFELSAPQSVPESSVEDDAPFGDPADRFASPVDDAVSSTKKLSEVAPAADLGVESEEVMDLMVREGLVESDGDAPSQEVLLQALRSRNEQYGQARDERDATAPADSLIAGRAQMKKDSAKVAGQKYGTNLPDAPRRFSIGPGGAPASAPRPNGFSREGELGRLAGGFMMPSDTTNLRVDGRQIRGVPAAERVEDLLDLLESSDEGRGPGMGGDKYDLIVENTFKRVAEHPLSTLSIDVDTASYSKVRMSLRGNRLPRPHAVRIEEMLNYFQYDYSETAGVLTLAPDPENEADSQTQAVEDRLKAGLQPWPFVAGMEVADCPWTPEHRLVRVGLQAIELKKKERPQCNLVFLIDTSGSMRSSNKLPLVLDGMKLLLKELRPDDRVAIVVYAGSAGLVLDSTPVKKKKKILNALTQLKSGGSTNGGAGLRLAYETARENFAKKGVNRVIMCSDGDFNVGMTGTDQLVREAKSQAKSGIDLTVLGFGMGNHNDAMMERISNDAEGNYGFIDTIAEAKKVLVDQLTGTLVTVAKDVKIQIEFNPAVVSSYRLIGYENRVLAKEDFNDDKKDAGEIGAGHRVTALYEVVPKGKLPAAIRPAVNPLKYQPNDDPEPEKVPDVSDETQTLTLHLRFKPPQGDTSTELVQELVDEGESFADADADFRFAAAVAGFGMQLRDSEHAGRWTYDDVIEVARSAKGSDPHGLRAEMVELAEKARSLTIKD